MRRAALVLLLVVAAACSSGDDDTAADTTTTSTTSTTTTPVATTTSTTIDLSVAPRAATDPAELAFQIKDAEEAVRDDSVTGDALALAAHTQQVAYRMLAAHPEWDDEVRGQLPEALRPVMDANVDAGRQLRSLVRSPKPNLPAWRIVAPEPMDHLRELYEAAEAEFGVPWEYLAAVHLTETRLGRIRGTSTAGAKGPMQFLPSTWDAYGEGGDIEDTGDSIRTAARYLKANGAPERMADALYRYNPTPKYVAAVTDYAEQMVADDHAFRGYYGWQVYYWSTLGDVWLRVGYEETAERPVTPEDVD